MPEAPADAASPSGKVSNQGSSKIQSAHQAEGSASTFFSVARQRLRVAEATRNCRAPKGRRPGHLGMKRSNHGVALRGFETDFAIALRVAFGGCVWL